MGTALKGGEGGELNTGVGVGEAKRLEIERVGRLFRIQEMAHKSLWINS